MSNRKETLFLEPAVKPPMVYYNCEEFLTEANLFNKQVAQSVAKENTKFKQLHAEVTRKLGKYAIVYDMLINAWFDIGSIIRPQDSRIGPRPVALGHECPLANNSKPTCTIGCMYTKSYM